MCISTYNFSVITGRVFDLYTNIAIRKYAFSEILANQRYVLTQSSESHGMTLIRPALRQALIVRRIAMGRIIARVMITMLAITTLDPPAEVPNPR